MVEGAALPVQMSLAVPNVQYASQFTLGMSPIEFLVSFGHTRPMLDAKGNLGGQALVEWTAIYSMSPSAAKQLALNLERAVKDYEKAFGEIPIDPEFKKRFEVE